MYKFRVREDFVRTVSFGFASAITLWPFGIYLLKIQYLSNRTLQNHENIHWEQQKELGGVLFYLLYLLEWLFKLPFYGKRTYYNLSAEREAHKFERDGEYLEKRKRYKWLKYIFKKP